MPDEDLFDIESGKTELVESLTVDCGQNIHSYPDQNFAVGPRVCEICGKTEY